MTDEQKTSFEQAGNQKQNGLFTDIWNMLKKNKKFWLIPLIIALLVIGLLVVAGGTAAAPFIYTLF